MEDLSRYKKFAKSTPVSKETNKNVWLYTRVSSSNQKDNYSLECQDEEASLFAKQKGYIITERFGNKSESASSDFTRKEFTELITRVKKSKIKPYGILVYVMSRFSRTGGNAIAIASELIDRTGVHLIEVSSGIDTSTDDGKLEIYNKLLEAKKQNSDRLKHTIPGMKKLVKSGKNLGSVPLGYDIYGPRVKDFERRALEQRIIINDDGKKLQLAWNWKSQGMPDYQILEKLRNLGLKMKKQTLSAIWRRPFYSGVQTNKLLGVEFVRGNWDAMVSDELFWKVQSIINQNHQGYTVSIENDERPLTGLLYCPKCSKKLTGYRNNKKNLHYYKCQTCKNVSINASTPSKKFPNHTGANDLFVEGLMQFSLKPELEKLYTLQVNKIVTCFKNSESNEDAVYKKQLTELMKKKEALEEQFAFGVIDKEMYLKHKGKVEGNISSLQAKYEVPEIDTSNIKMNLNKATDFVQNINKYWGSANVSTKKRIQNLMFPRGLVLSSEKRQYLTSKINALFELKQEFMSLSED